jgi:hypothetical protein
MLAEATELRTAAPGEMPAPRPRLVTHPECGSCCAVGACHFCAGLAAGQYSASHRGHTYFACAAHRGEAVEAMKNDPRCPRPGARMYPLSPLLT